MRYVLCYNLADLWIMKRSLYLQTFVIYEILLNKYEYGCIWQYLI